MFAGAAAVMQAVESQTLILYHTDLRGQWPEEGARALTRRLPYGKRLGLGSGAHAQASLAGVALALRALARLTGRRVQPDELRFVPDAKPELVTTGAPGCDFSIAHSGPFVGCAALRGGQVGFDVEVGAGARLGEWVAREAVVKACGAGVRALAEVQLRDGGACCRGRAWYARTLGHFPGAAACVMTSSQLQGIEAQAVPLAELFVT